LETTTEVIRFIMDTNFNNARHNNGKQCNQSDLQHLRILWATQSQSKPKKCVQQPTINEQTLWDLEGWTGLIMASRRVATMSWMSN